MGVGEGSVCASVQNMGGGYDSQAKFVVVLFFEF